MSMILRYDFRSILAALFVYFRFLSVLFLFLIM